MNPLLIIAIPLVLVIIGMVLNSIGLAYDQPPSSSEQDPVKRLLRKRNRIAGSLLRGVDPSKGRKGSASMAGCYGCHLSAPSFGGNLMRYLTSLPRCRVTERTRFVSGANSSVPNV